MHRTAATIFSVAVLAGVLSPAVQNLRERPRDDFPLSYYPMFSKVHPPIQRHVSIVGIEGDGARRPIHYRYAGSGGMNQVRRQIARAVRRGDAAADELCARVARRIVRRADPELRSLVEVRVVSGRYDVLAYFRDDRREPISEEVHAVRTLDRPAPTPAPGPTVAHDPAVSGEAVDR